MRRRSRSYRRFHTERIIKKRVRQAKRLAWWMAPGWEPVRGRLADEQFYIGCHRPRCGVCHPEKRWGYGDRQREERAWRAEEWA